MTGRRSKMRTHASNPTWKRLRRDAEATLTRAEKQAARRARTPLGRELWADAPHRCPVCGRGLSDRYRAEPHYRRVPRRHRVRGERPVWCPGFPGFEL